MSMCYTGTAAATEAISPTQSNLTTQRTEPLTVTPREDPINMSNATESKSRKFRKSRKPRKPRKGDSGSEREMALHLKTIVEISNNISTTLDVIVDRSFSMDYRQPNFSCPNWNRGNYQYIGPDGYYSTCYYVQSNV